MENTPDTPAMSAAPLTLEAIYTDNIFEPKPLRQPHWLKDGKQFSFLDAALKQETARTQASDKEADDKAGNKETTDKELLTLWIFDVERRQRAPIIAAEVLQMAPEPLTIHSYLWSPDETRVLLARPPRAHDPEGDTELWIYTLATRALTCVARGGEGEEFRNVKWSPDGLRLGYVRADDLYVLDLESGTEQRLTNDASPTVYNGRFGWVYQEELYLVDGWAWSPDGQHIAYCQCDETQVPVVPLTRYETLHLAPELQRYPKAGDPNPVVRVGVVKVTEEETNTQGAVTSTRGEALSSPLLLFSPSTLWLDVAPDTDIYIAQIQWTPDGELLIQRILRLQNQADLLRADLQTGTTTVLLTETDAAWVDAPGKLTFAGENGDFVWPSDRDGWRHLYLYDRNGQMLRQLTHGEWDVNKIVAADDVNRQVYFTASHPLPRQQHLFTVGLDGGEITQITTGAGTHNALFSPDTFLFLHTYSTRMIPPHTDICRADGQFVVTVADNPMPEARAHLRSAWEFTTLQVEDKNTGRDIALEAALLRPPDYDPARKYPLLMYTYGGPGSQVVVDAWGSRIGLEQYLAQQGYVLALVDGRGAGGRGRDFKKVTYLNLGQYEAEDQIAAARQLAALPYVDSARIGIWGWSYGGFMASLCILRGADVFKVGVAVAPVTDFKLYDSIYTERYMRRPLDNPDGYERSAPLKYAENLQGKFLLVHGLDDDNVHFQNAAQLAALFQQHNKPFQMMAYPGKHHGLEGVAPHWAALIADFIRHNL